MYCGGLAMTIRFQIILAAIIHGGYSVMLFGAPSMASVAVFCALLFSGVTLAWQASRIVNDRRNEMDFRRKCAWMTASPHLAPGEPWMRPVRVDPKTAFYQTRPYRGTYPTEGRALAA